MTDFALQHPLALITYTKRKFWLLLIPVIRRLIVINFDVIEWIAWGFWDLLLLALLAAVILWQYFSMRYKFTDTEVIVRDSFLIRRQFSIPYRRMSLVLSKETFWSRPFNAVRLQLESEAKSVFNRRRSSDVVIVTNRIIAGRLFYRLKHGTTVGRKSSRTVSYRNPRSLLFVFSILFSSAFSGGVYLFLLLYQSTDIIGETLGLRYSDIIGGFTEFAQSIIDGISSTLVAIIVIIAGGWLYSFISNILRLQNYRLTMKSNYIEIKSGYFSHWNYHINRDYIKYTDIRQNIIMKLFGLYSVNIGCTGYGRARGEIPVFIPITELPAGGAVLEMFLPGLQAEIDSGKTRIRTVKRAVFRLLWKPAFLILGFFAAYLIMCLIAPKFIKLYIFLLVMALLPSFMYLAACIIEYKNSGVSKGTAYRHVISYCRKRFTAHCVIIPDIKVCTVRTSQTVFQRRNRTSDITIITCGERGVKYRVKSVKLSETDII